MNWTGQANDNRFDNPNNWEGGVVPVNPRDEDNWPEPIPASERLPEVEPEGWCPNSELPGKTARFAPEGGNHD